jgi:hypothetical protein
MLPCLLCCGGVLEESIDINKGAERGNIDKR